MQQSVYRSSVHFSTTIFSFFSTKQLESVQLVLRISSLSVRATQPTQLATRLETKYEPIPLATSQLATKHEAMQLATSQFATKHEAIHPSTSQLINQCATTNVQHTTQTPPTE
jgi:hypothetical protein